MLSFGLKNAPFCFFKLMHRVFHGSNDFALPYLEYIGVFSDSWVMHLNHLRNLFECLSAAGLTVKTEKCNLGGGLSELLGTCSQARTLDAF